MNGDLTCKQGHPMAFAERFLFAPEPGDPPRMAAQFERFRAMGLQLGATVEVWRCLTCGDVTADFSWPDASAGHGTR
jgi:hypothetical protein